VSQEHYSIGRKFRVALPRTYSVGPPRPSWERFVASAVPSEREPKICAIWIVHGMGQQLPYETVNGLAEGIMHVANPVPGRDGFEPRVRRVQIGNQAMQRVELDISENGIHFELHLYEAYWAPVTEGNVKLPEVIHFILSAGLGGLLSAFRPLRRAMFDQTVETRLQIGAALEITLALLALVCLIVVNAVIVAAGAFEYGLNGYKLPQISANWANLSAIASWLSGVGIAFGLILFLAERSQIPFRAVKKWRQRIISSAVWMAFFMTLAALVAAAVSMAGFSLYSGSKHLPAEILSLSPKLEAISSVLVAAIVGITLIVLTTKRILILLRAEILLEIASVVYYESFFLVSLGLFLVAFFGPVLITLAPIARVYSFLPMWLSYTFWVWPLLLLLSALVRELVIQYVGDVAAYVTSRNIDRFGEMRERIKGIAMDSARAVYLAREGEEFLYEKIAVVGHSLGSVIAYDTLNALLNTERMSPSGLRIAARTCLFETFGSPLDKIAFFFSVQSKRTDHIRGQLALTAQPLISNYEEFRKFPWINVYSPNDIVSGRVELYDLPVEGQPDEVRRIIRRCRVQDFRDHDAFVPLVAHVAYWKNTEVWKQLLRAVTR
jgi:hypothetical protein